MRILTIIALLLFTGCCGSTANIVSDEFGQIDKYTLPFEGGYYLTESGKMKTLLKFYRPNELFKKDTDERLHLYIVCDEENLQNMSSNTAMEAFFIRVQLHPQHGFMVIEDLGINKEPNERISASGKLYNETVNTEVSGSIRITVEFKNLPLMEVESVTELHKHSSEYYNEVLRQKFASWTS
jgi:hypothetical protein